MCIRDRHCVMGCHCFLRYHRSQRCQHPQCRAQRLGTNLARRSNRPHLHNRREISATLPQTYRAAPDRSLYRHRHDPTALHQPGQRLNAFAGPYLRLSRSFSKGKRTRECVLEKLEAWRNHQSRTANPASRILPCISLAIAIQRAREIPAFTPTLAKSATVMFFPLPLTEVVCSPLVPGFSVKSYPGDNLHAWRERSYRQEKFFA